ncbi:MAG: hypothetical protein GX267_00105 [Fibrobacter sp.]|jgi:hypothetical protein|nr:hypothetical protein [Fibrobacter sp.]
MRLIKWTVLLVSTITFFASAQKIAQPVKEGVKVYKSDTRQLYEEAMLTVGTSDRLQVLDSKRDMHKIKTSDGTIGWVEKKDVSVLSGKSKTFVFDNAEVVGYLDNPTPVYIIDTDDPNADPISLDRSFKDALRENIDKETVERQTK